MQQVSILLPSTAQVQRFVKALTPLQGDFEVLSDNYILDARSLMGLFSLELSAPLTLRLSDGSPENLDAIAPFLSETEGTTHE